MFHLLVVCMSCNQEETSVFIIEKAKEKLSDASSVSYKYKSIVDNKFNDTKYSDTAEIVYYQVENSLHGYGLHALSRNEEYLFDGNQFEKLKPSENVRVVFDRANIEQDSNYFYNLSFFSTNPIRVKEYELDEAIKSVINEKAYYIYKNETQNQSHSDSSKTVQYQKFFYVEIVSKNISRVEEMIIKENDTLQIVNHYFTDYVYNRPINKTPGFNKRDKANYRTVSEEDEDEEFTYTPIKEGEILSKKTYININNKVVDIYGEAQKSTLIMFSFIGCAPCEMALKDFKAAKYQLKDNVNMHYSSFQNTSASLKKYLKKKEFPFMAFGKESEMITDFSLFHSRSFAFIDSNGKIIKVIEGYDDDVKNELFDLAFKN